MHNIARQVRNSGPCLIWNTSIVDEPSGSSAIIQARTNWLNRWSLGMTKQHAIPGLKVILAAGVFALVTGCASTADLERAQSDANQARQAAEAAQTEAQDAARVAREALEAARAAQQTADGAQRCCDEVQEKLDRAMERMQEK